MYIPSSRQTLSASALKLPCSCLAGRYAPNQGLSSAPAPCQHMWLRNHFEWSIFCLTETEVSGAQEIYGTTPSFNPAPALSRCWKIAGIVTIAARHAATCQRSRRRSVTLPTHFGTACYCIYELIPKPLLLFPTAISQFLTQQTTSYHLRVIDGPTEIEQRT